MVRTIGWHFGMCVVLLAAVPGCDSHCGCGWDEEGSPQVRLGPVDGGAVTATIPNPCELHVNFGAVPIGQGASAFIQVENIGSGPLDLAQINPTLNAQFGLDYGTQQPVESGEFGQFAVTFEASTFGTVSSSFSILTDGANSRCPSDDGGVTVLTVALTGSASN
jgi:hypothetical protein